MKGMTNEELLKPRFKVTADYPDSDYIVGQILSFNKFSYSQGEKNFYAYGEKRLYENYFIPYPYLFKKLSWWEEREIKDMPEYVCFTESPNKEIWEVKEWKISKAFGMEFWTEDEGRRFRNICSECSIIPATQSEYESQNKKV